MNTFFSVFKHKVGFLLLLLGVVFGQVQAESQVPSSLKDIGITEKLGQVLPLDTIFRDENGTQVTLAEYFQSGKPVILNLVYFDCPMLCNLVLTGFVEGLQKMPLRMGQDFEVVSISINPQDTPEDAVKYKSKYLEKLHQPQAEKGWHFLVGQEASIKKIASSVGFMYRFDTQTKQYAHAAALFFVSPEGKTARYLYGIEYKPFDLRMALVEAKERKQISTVERALLFCYNYDSHARGYALYAANFMRAGAGLTLIILLGFLYRLNKKFKKQ